MTRRGQQKNEKYSGIAKQIYFVSQTEERRNGNKWFALLIKNNKIFRELSFLVFDILKASSKLLYCIRHPVWMGLLKVLSPKRKFYFRKNNVKLKQERNHFVLKSHQLGSFEELERLLQDDLWVSKCCSFAEAIVVAFHVETKKAFIYHSLLLH